MSVAPIRVQRLYIGKRFTGVTVCEDADWPGMWRVHSAGGQISDMVNLTRAKDAAIAYARPRGLGGEEVAHWTVGKPAVEPGPCVLPTAPYAEAAE